MRMFWIRVEFISGKVIRGAVNAYDKYDAGEQVLATLPAGARFKLTVDAL